MTRKTLIIAGWLAMISAFVSIPLVYISYRLQGRVDATATIIQSILQISGTFMFVAINLYLRNFLNGNFRFHDTDRSIDLMIKAGVIAGILTLLSLYYTPIKETIAIAVIVILVAQGIVQVQFGYKLLRLHNDFGGILKPFCYANMATGILIVTVVLIPVGVVVSAIADLMLGTIFFNVARMAGEPDLERAE